MSLGARRVQQLAQLGRFAQSGGMDDGIGRTQLERDEMDPARAAALAAVLGQVFDPAAPLPPFAHQVYFWQALPAPLLGRDGHPARGGFIPDLGLPRRMWAGGRLEFLAPLMAGRVAEKTTVIEAVTRKAGRSGPLGFVTLRHEIRQGGAHCLTEWQDLVYRADPQPGTPPPEAPQAPAGGEVMRRRFSTVDLFRYSALTFNGHRIHYDRDYAREVEGYGGLVVHGPLLAQWLMLIAAKRLGRLGRFTFRGVSAALDFEELRFCQDGALLWVAGPDGRLCLSAEAG
ncbi:acyl dehydratase [Phaeovulum sp.]|uniref:acyl dehydratase n=1 Tax=Phaeovulum sp. TaxID=2934796 RepID=UPI003562ED52